MTRNNNMIQSKIAADRKAAERKGADGFASSADSIRYDLCFQSCLLAFADAQLAPEENPGGFGATPEQEAEQRETLFQLCDTIDLFVQKRAEADLLKVQQNKEALQGGAKSEAAGTS